MRIRESGMPDESMWESFFDARGILQAFAVDRFDDVIEVGCGYGTFSIPLAQAIRGELFAYDIDPEMVARTHQRAVEADFGENLKCEVCDVFQATIPKTVDAVLLFNNLHCEAPETLLELARSWIHPRGEILVIHWRSDIATPRGPSAAIRPTPDHIRAWSESAGLIATEVSIPAQWHFGLKLRIDLTEGRQGR